MAENKIKNIVFIMLDTLRSYFQDENQLEFCKASFNNYIGCVKSLPSGNGNPHPGTESLR